MSLLLPAPRPLARVVPKVAGKALGKRGMAFGALMTDWATILGPELGRCTMPQKLAFPPGLRQDEHDALMSTTLAPFIRTKLDLVDRPQWHSLDWRALASAGRVQQDQELWIDP